MSMGNICHASMVKFLPPVRVHGTTISEAALYIYIL